MGLDGEEGTSKLRGDRKRTEHILQNQFIGKKCIFQWLLEVEKKIERGIKTTLTLYKKVKIPRVSLLNHAFIFRPSVILIRDLSVVSAVFY